MAGAAFDLEQERLRIARTLPAHCYDDFQRLSRRLVYGPEFQWLLVDAPHEGLRRQVMDALDAVLRAAKLRHNRLPLSEKIGDAAGLEARLTKNAAQAQVVHVIGRPGWFDATRWDALNVRRERIAAAARARIVFWLDDEAMTAASRHAPDLWAWRAGEYRFAPETLPAGQATQIRLEAGRPSSGFDARSAQQKHRRVAQIRDWLQAHRDAPDELRIEPLDELGRIHFELGELDAALALWRELLPLHRRRGDELAVALTQGRIASVHQARGAYDDALRIRYEDELPEYERLGDARARAIAQGQIADMLQARGQLDEALRIRREEELPVYERLGDARARAITQGKIADVLQARGDWDAALRIRREEQLPVYERLGDVREQAITQGQIADALQARGQFDEALRVRREQELPVFERLGAVRERAITQGRIADVLEARGQWDEALRIRREDELPAFERLGDAREAAVARWKIGHALLAARPQDQPDAVRLLWSAYLTAERMGLAETQALRGELERLGLPRPADLPDPPTT